MIHLSLNKQGGYVRNLPNFYSSVCMSDVKCYYQHGNTAPLTLWIISDFDCSVCKELQPVFDAVGNKFKDKINYTHVFMSARVTQAAIAAECAANQGKFMEMKKLLYNNTENHEIKLYVRLANETGLDTIRFKRDFNDPTSSTQ